MVKEINRTKLKRTDDKVWLSEYEAVTDVLEPFCDHSGSFEVVTYARDSNNLDICNTCDHMVIWTNRKEIENNGRR